MRRGIRGYREYRVYGAVAGASGRVCTEHVHIYPGGAFLSSIQAGAREVYRPVGVMLPRVSVGLAREPARGVIQDYVRENIREVGATIF